jgi:hypothetical protein
VSGIQYIDVHESDLIFAGEVYRCGFSRGNVLQAFISTPDAFGALWDDKIAATKLAYPVSPRPETAADASALDGGTDVAVIDVKVVTGAPSMSVGDFASALNGADLFTTLETIQWIDEATSLAPAVAPTQRAATEDQVNKKRQSEDPIANLIGNLGAIVKYGLIAAAAVGTGLVIWLYFPRKHAE